MVCDVIARVNEDLVGDHVLYLMTIVDPGRMAPGEILAFLKNAYHSDSVNANSTEYADFHRACRVALSWTHNFAPEKVDEFLAGLEPFPEDQE
jgi:hypothetical protein